MVRLTDRPDMTLDVYRGRKTTKQQRFDCNITSHSYIIYLPCSVIECLVVIYTARVQGLILAMADLEVFYKSLTGKSQCTGL